MGFYGRGRLTDYNGEQEWDPTSRYEKLEREREQWCAPFGTQSHARSSPASLRPLTERGSQSWIIDNKDIIIDFDQVLLIMCVYMCL